MKAERMIGILAEEMSKDTQIKIGQPFKLCSYDDALTAMQRAVEEETARLRECEAIVRELADVKSLEALDAIQDTARQWVENNPK